jgi:hypothetical protein
VTSRALVKLGTFAAVVLAGIGIVIAAPATADTVICDQYGRTSINGGQHFVQNNRWGASTTQCITVSATASR